jgi:hypothetical protein
VPPQLPFEDDAAVAWQSQIAVISTGSDAQQTPGAQRVSIALSAAGVSALLATNKAKELADTVAATMAHSNTHCHRHSNKAGSIVATGGAAAAAATTTTVAFERPEMAGDCLKKKNNERHHLQREDKKRRMKQGELGVHFRENAKEMGDFGHCRLGAVYTCKLELCNNTSETVVVCVKNPPLPFVVLHHRIQMRPRSFVKLPVRFIPTKATGKGAECSALIEAVLEGNDGSSGGVNNSVCSVQVRGCGC